MRLEPETADPLAKVAAWDAAAEQAATPCGDGTLRWRIWGEGRPLLLLHGGSGSWRHWIRNLPVLTRQARVFAPDLPGLGDSALPPEPWNLHDIGAIVADGLDQLLAPGGEFDVMGFSFGSLVAGAVAAQRPNRVGTVILVGASGLGLPRGAVALEKVRSLQGEARQAAHHTNLQRLMIADPARIDEQALAIQDVNTRLARLRSVGLSTTTVLLEALAASHARLGAVWGAKDAVARDTLPERAAALRRLRPNAAIHVVPSAGHWVAYEAADAFHDAIAGLLPGGGTGGTHG